MSNLINNIERIKLIFLTEVYPKIKSGKIVPNIIFIFDDKTILSFIELKNKITNEQKIIKLNKNINLLKEDSQNINDDLKINIQNSELFFFYLMELSNAIYNQEVSYYGNADNEIDEIMMYIWLRMSPSDFNDVITFLKRQISFSYNDTNITNNNKTWENIGNYDKYKVSYIKYLNELYYESNTSICMRLEENEKTYTLPSIFYGITTESGQQVCYIYGIQNNDTLTKNNNIEISNELKKLNKGKNNHGTFITFVIALEKFIELLKENGITTIKVPLLQVLNYQFHELLSIKEKENLLKNFPNAKGLDKLIEVGITNEEIEKYNNYKKIWYIHTVDKEEEISKRKTEGLINIFRRLEDQKGIIKIKTTPFINDENLIIEISSHLNKQKKH